MAAKIIGRIDTLPDTWDCITFGPVSRDAWIDTMFEQHDNCASHWCFTNWCWLVIHTYKEHGVPLPRKGKMPTKEYSRVLVNDLTHMMGVPYEF